MEQPLNNIVRAALQVLASVFAGTQSLHTCSYDEAVGLPSEDAVRTAIRVNQIILNETKVDCVSDPLGGSYYVEWLTDRMEEEAVNVMDEIEERGGFCKCVEDGYLREVLRDQVLKWRQQLDSNERTVVGLNRFKTEEQVNVPPFASDEKAAEIITKRLRKWKKSRDNSKVKEALDEVEQAMHDFESAENAGKLMPTLIEAARAKCTLGEMMGSIYKATGGRIYAAEYGRL